MKARPLILLAVVLVVLVALKVFQNATHRAETQTTGLENLMSDLPAAQIGRVVITGPAGGEVDLARSGDGWVVASSFGHPAGESNVQRVLDGLEGIKGELRSEKEEVLPDYGLDSLKAVRLQVYDLDGSERTDLLLGNQVTGGSGFFLCRDGESRVYASQGNLMSSLGLWGENREPEGKRFLDLKVFSVEREQVDSLKIDNGETRMILAKSFAAPAADSLPVDRSQFTWMLDGKEAKKSAGDQVLSALASVYARDLLDPSGDYGFAEGARRVDVVLADGETKSVEFGNTVSEPEEGLAMRIPGKDFVYLVYANLTDRIFKQPADFKPDES